MEICSKYVFCWPLNLYSGLTDDLASVQPHPECKTWASSFGVGKILHDSTQVQFVLSKMNKKNEYVPWTMISPRKGYVICFDQVEVHSCWEMHICKGTAKTRWGNLLEKNWGASWEELKPIFHLLISCRKYSPTFFQVGKRGFFFREDM